MKTKLKIIFVSTLVSSVFISPLSYAKLSSMPELSSSLIMQAINSSASCSSKQICLLQSTSRLRLQLVSSAFGYIRDA